MFYLSGVALAVFLDLLLLAKRQKSKADWILACWLLIIGIHLLMVTFLRLKLYPQIWGIDLPLPLLHGPLLFLYTLALTGTQVSLRHLLIHLSLPLAFYIYLISFIALPASEKLFVYENEGLGYETFLSVRNVCIPVSGVTYILLSLYTLRKHRLAIVERFSSVDKINLNWLRNLIIWLSFIWLLVLFGNDDWIFSATVVFTFFIGFFGIRQGLIFNTDTSEHDGNEEKNKVSHEENTGTAMTADTAKYQKSGLSDRASEALHRQLNSLMLEEKTYTNSEVSLTDLADRLNVPLNHLSQVINEREGKNFYDYINTLRIQEFITIAGFPESRRMTLFGLAQQCGFNSKSSFNRYFKKITGKSPSEYMQELSPSEN